MMRWLRGIAERVKVLLSPSRFESDMDEELRFHVEEATRRNVERGMTPEAARRAALRDLGGVETTKERVRDETGVRLLQDVVQDVRYGLRTLARRPGFAFALLATISIAVGANSAVFSLVHSILLAPLPFDEPDRIVRIYNSYPAGNVSAAGNSVRDYYDRRDGLQAFEDVALFNDIAHTLGGEDGPQHVFAMQVTPSFFEVFRARPALGTLFPNDLVRGAANYVVIGDDLWRRGFAADPEIVGTTIILDGGSYEVIGVLPEHFEFATWDAQVYTPLVFDTDAAFSRARNADRYDMVARLRPGASIDGAQREIDALNARRIEEYPVEDRNAAIASGFRTEVRGYLADLTASIRRPLLLLWLGAAIVMLAAVTNICTLFLVRATGRRREISCRLALGAGRARIVRQLLAESIAVALAGGVMGVVLARWSLRFLGAFEVYEIPRVDDVGIDAPIIVGGILAAVAIGCLAALVPARGLLWGAAKELKGGLRGGPGERPSRVHHLLVGLQLSFAFVLLMTTGLLVESLRHMNAVDTGFDPEGVAVGATSIPWQSYPGAEARVQFVTELTEGVGAHPDVEAVAVATQLPFSDFTNSTPVTSEAAGGGAGSESFIRAYRTGVSEGYFGALGLESVSGRLFSTADDVDAPRVAIVDEALARLLWPGAPAVGRRIWFDESAGDPETAVEVVGVVESIRQNSLTEQQLTGAVYLPFAQHSTQFFRIATRTRGEVSDVPPIAREVLAGIDPTLLYYWVDDLGAAVDGSLLFRRLPMMLLSVFAGVSLFLVVLGVYGVTTYVVSARTRELGLRMALGGTKPGVAGLLAKEWATVAVLGLGVGAAGTFVVLQVVQSLLYGTGALDVTVVLPAITLLFAAAALSFLWPVRHALRIDPARALGSD